jgi:hypothetical protein
LTPSPTPPTETPSDPAKGPSPEPGKTPPLPGPPESYTFTPPEGQTYDQSVIDAATPVFRELGLTQAQADKLVDLQSKLARSDADNALKTIQEMDRGFRAKLEADPDLGPNLDKVKTDIGRAFDIALTPKERTAFAEAMVATGLSNHPDISRTIWKLAQRIAPGSHVSGRGPSPDGQSPNGATARPSVAEAMFPNLASSRAS